MIYQICSIRRYNLMSLGWTDDYSVFAAVSVMALTSESKVRRAHACHLHGATHVTGTGPRMSLARGHACHLAGLV